MMKFDAMLRVRNLREAPGIASEHEAAGYDGLWTAEKDHDPYLTLALAVSATTKPTLGTAIALAFNRSPMSIAQTAWNLQAASNGRFILGLGSQVRAHMERRFSAEWDRPVERMQDVVRSLRAIWTCWQTDGRLDFQGEFYRFTLMTPAFTPPPLEGAPPPIFLGGVNRNMIRLAGALCDGFHVHPFHSREYLRSVVLPTVREGALSSGRRLEDVTISASAFCVTDETSRRAVRDQLSFYASTKAYRPILAAHGWEDVGIALGRMAAAGEWDRMPVLISDDMIEAFSIIGKPGEVRRLAEQRYGAMVQRVTINEGPGAGRVPKG